MIKKTLVICICFLNLFYLKSQTINLNESNLENILRRAQLQRKIDSTLSFSIRPLNIGEKGINFDKSVFNKEKYSPTILSFFNNKGKIKILPINFNINYRSHHPYNRNNGSMIPSKGYQHLLSAGFYGEIGPLSFQFKPEFIYAENKEYPGFWTDHYDVIWERRFRLWNQADLPERFGDNEFKKSYLGQSSIRVNYKGISLGLSSENIWWGPSIRNSIMMSNHAKGFNHITFNTIRPIKTPIGSFEWQLVSGRLESSGFLPPEHLRTYNGRHIFNPRVNQMGYPDWRYFQGFSFTYSPKWISGLSVGAIRWVQMYSALVEGKYWWMKGGTSYFPVFKNIFRKNDLYLVAEAQIDQAAGLFFRWLWTDSMAEVYGEFHYNDSKFNLRDLFSDSDHSRAFTIGINKLFKGNKKSSFYEFKWEWTELEQAGSRKIRDAGSWYMHYRTFDGYTNRGEVLGAGIGPGSNSQFLSLSKINDKSKIGLALEIVENDNDFYYYAFADSSDYRRYWKDYNLHLNFDKEYGKFWTSINLIYSRSLNYQWELERINPNGSEYYYPGNDTNNLHLDIKITYPLSF